MESAREILSSGFPDNSQHSVERPPVATWQLSIKVSPTVHQITFYTAAITHAQTFTLLRPHPLHSSAFTSRLTSDLWLQGPAGTLGDPPPLNHAMSLQHWSDCRGSAAPSVHSSAPSVHVSTPPLPPLPSVPSSPFWVEMFDNSQSADYRPLTGTRRPQTVCLGWTSISCSSSKCTACMVEIRVSHYGECVGRDFQSLQLDLHSL